MSRRSVGEVHEVVEGLATPMAEHEQPSPDTRDGPPADEARPVQKARTLGEFLDTVATLGSRLDPGDREAFARDLEAAHTELNALPLPRDPWEC